MSETRYSKDHEWIRIAGKTATVGITDYAQAQLGDLVYVELPEVGRGLIPGDDAAVVESAKAASDVYAPITGEVSAINDAIVEDPSIVNADAEGDGWFWKMSIEDASEIEDLMELDAYKSYLESLD